MPHSCRSLMTLPGAVPQPTSQPKPDLGAAETGPRPPKERNLHLPKGRQPGTMDPLSAGSEYYKNLKTLSWPW